MNFDTILSSSPVTFINFSYEITPQRDKRLISAKAWQERVLKAQPQKNIMMIHLDCHYYVSKQFPLT